MPHKKHLILTYGVTAGRQRTVQLSLSRVNALLVGLTVMALWTTGSFGYFLLAGFRTEAPAVAKSSPVVARKCEPQPQPQPLKCQEPVEKPKAVAAVPVPAAAPVPVQEAPEVPQLAASLENYRADETVGKLVARFGVRNLSGETLRGKVRGEAEFVALDGSLKTIKSEQEYKARTLSSKQLIFTAPGPGKFTKVKITVDDKATQRDVVFFR